MNRRDFLFGSAAGLAAGAAISKGSDLIRNRSEEKGFLDALAGTNVSYAQQGEDIIVKNILDTFQISNPTYLDIGAFDPIVGSNTYLLYLQGSRGILIEPNPALCARLKAVRKKDIVLNIGIGVTDQKSADYYIIAGDGQLNTFSKDQANQLVKLHGPQMIKQVIKMPLVNINEVLDQHLKGSPNFLSVDVEGMDLDILKSLDFSRFRPEVICVETSKLGTGELIKSIIDFLDSKGYSIRGGTFVNSIFLDNALLRQRAPWLKKGDKS